MAFLELQKLKGLEKSLETRRELTQKQAIFPSPTGYNPFIKTSNSKPYSSHLSPVTALSNQAKAHSTGCNPFIRTSNSKPSSSHLSPVTALSNQAKAHSTGCNPFIRTSNSKPSSSHLSPVTALSKQAKAYSTEKPAAPDVTPLKLESLIVQCAGVKHESLIVQCSGDTVRGEKLIAPETKLLILPTKKTATDDLNIIISKETSPTVKNTTLKITTLKPDNIERMVSIGHAEYVVDSPKVVTKTEKEAISVSFPVQERILRRDRHGRLPSALKTGI
jgi:hypothetical protein